MRWILFVFFASPAGGADIETHVFANKAPCERAAAKLSEHPAILAVCVPTE